MYLELLSPARNLEIGIAAIDSGADAVYIGGPFFGARRDAGNSVEDIASLCEYAHRFGARVFVTVNIVVSEDELPELHAQMLASQAAGVDAFIVRDERISPGKTLRFRFMPPPSVQSEHRRMPVATRPWGLPAW